MKPKCACFEHGVGEAKTEEAALIAASAIGGAADLCGICPEAIEHFLHKTFAMVLRGLAMQRANSEVCDAQMAELMKGLADGVRDVDMVMETQMAVEGMTRQ
jgi:hypothetical protein